MSIIAPQGVTGDKRKKAKMTTSGGLPRRRPAAPDTEQHKPAPKAHAKTTYKKRRWVGQ